MHCKNSKCGAEIPKAAVEWPEGQAPPGGRTQREFDHPVARCPRCGRLNSAVKKPGGAIGTVKLLEEQ